MRLALDEARRGDYPFGAVIVRDDKVIARGRNLGKVHDEPTAHAEMRRFGAPWPNTAARRCAASPFTRPASRARCAWAQSYGAISGGSFSPRP